MKRMLLLILCVCFTLTLCACGKSAPAQEAQTLPLPQTGDSTGPIGPSPMAPTAEASISAPPTVLTPAEYVLYTNIFYNQTGDEYVGQSVTKTGTLARIEDAFNGCIRWYVWGYNDQTKCCDWQWEIVPKDTSALPAIGSLVEVTGTFAGADEALDGYWIEQAEVREKTAYDTPAADCVMTAMSDTLERVQLLNMQHFSERFEGRAVLAYGRIAGPGEIQDPYYDGSWTQKFSSDDELPPIGTVVILRGTWRGGVIEDCAIVPTQEY